LGSLTLETADRAVSKDISWSQVNCKRRVKSRADRIPTRANHLSDTRRIESRHDEEHGLSAQAAIGAQCD